MSSAYPPPASTARFSAISSLGWAAFLACSWTWCIGMFLPALLVRDQGVWAWVVFALPNVIGAAAMGWVLQRPGSSESMTARHAGAMTAFSLVTILFHVLFVGWVVMWLGGWSWVAAVGAVAVLSFPILRIRQATLVLSVIVLLVSIACFATAVATTDHAPVPATGMRGGLLPLAVVSALGFGLCPYLDLTFHRARQATGTYAAIAAFTIGFGVFFLLMILFTLWYAPLVLPPDAAGSGAAIPATVLLAIIAHMTAQSGFTVAAHAVEVVRQIRRRNPEVRWGLLSGLLLGIAAIVVAHIVRDRGGYRAILSGPELGYRLFMAFYALVAPAYVMTRVIPWPRSRSTDRGRWTAFAIAVALASPAFWFGFIEQQMTWVLAGAAVILLARPMLEWSAKPGSR